MFTAVVIFEIDGHDGDEMRDFGTLEAARAWLADHTYQATQEVWQADKLVWASYWKD